MTTINVGAQYESRTVEAGVRRVPSWVHTTRTLAYLARAYPERLLFINTSPFTQGTPQRFHLADIVEREDVVLNVVGPNPWLSCTWQARVHVEAGRLVVE